MSSEMSIEPFALQCALDNGKELILDVRTPAEYRREHIEDAKMVPLADLEPKEFLNEQRACSRIFVISQSGVRARKAIGAFNKMGCTGCVLVKGGMDAWVRAGLPIERNYPTGLSIAQQVQITVGIIVAIGFLLTLFVDARFVWILLFVVGGQILAKTTGFWEISLILGRMPWNRMPKKMGTTATGTRTLCEARNQLSQRY